jgi:hypothetical protein
MLRKEDMESNMYVVERRLSSILALFSMPDAPREKEALRA